MSKHLTLLKRNRFSSYSAEIHWKFSFHIADHLKAKNSLYIGIYHGLFTNGWETVRVKSSK